MQRNDLTLEADLLAPHADALSAGLSAEPSPKPVGPDATRQRAKAWRSLWTEFESTAEALRASHEIDDIWKTHLDSTLKEARTAHDSLAVMLGNLKDEGAAQAVIDFSAVYFSTTTEMYLDDDSKFGK
jgi:hypothetical protein